MKFSNDYALEKQTAREANLGVWNLTCHTPWAFREQRWQSAVNHAVSQHAPEGCPIKGNISSHGCIYHLPWDRYYTKTKIDLGKGEHWFCDEKEALAAGWRRARQ